MAVNNTSELKFYTNKNLVEDDFTKWQLENAVVEDSKIIIEDKGVIEFSNITEDTLKASNNIKVVVDLNSTITKEYNYKNMLYLHITEYYTEEEEQRSKVRTIAINEYNTKYKKKKGNYRSKYVYKTVNKDLTKLRVKLYNVSGKQHTISKIAVYRSQDITASQIEDAGGSIGGDGGGSSPITVGTYIECRTDDPVDLAPGRIWLRIDL